MHTYHDSHIGKCVKTEAYELVNKGYLKWFTALKNNTVLICGPVLKAKACDFVKELGIIRNFQASGGWLEKWRKR